METIAGPISIKKIFDDNRNFFKKQNVGKIRDHSIKSIDKILQCGTGELGFTTYKCTECNDTKHIAFTCKSRFCNSCSQPQSDIRMNRLIKWRPTSLLYNHLIFTIPQELRIFFKKHRGALKIIPATAKQSIFYFVKDQKLKLGVLAVIHSFGSQLNRNPHTHLIITHDGIHKSGRIKKKVYLPYKAIRTSWTKYLLKNLKERANANLDGEMRKKEIKFLNQFYDYHSKVTEQSATWYVFFSKKPCSFKQVVGYVGRYIKRPVISQSRILEYDGNSVSYCYKDKRDDQTKKITCSALDFMGLLLQHLPNKGFHMIYYYGIFANRSKSKYLKLLNTYFNNTQKLPIIPTSYSQRIYFFTGKNPLLCQCGGVFCKYKVTVIGYPVKYLNSS